MPKLNFPNAARVQGFKPGSSAGHPTNKHTQMAQPIEANCRGLPVAPGDLIQWLQAFHGLAQVRRQRRDQLLALDRGHPVWSGRVRRPPAYVIQVLHIQSKIQYVCARVRVWLPIAVWHAELAAMLQPNLALLEWVESCPSSCAIQQPFSCA